VEHGAAEQRNDLSAIKQAAWEKRWVVDVESVGNGRNVVRYLARYVHRTAVAGGARVHRALPSEATLPKPPRPGKRVVWIGRNNFAGNVSLHV
jgi:hypothetical protein